MPACKAVICVIQRLINDLAHSIKYAAAKCSAIQPAAEPRDLSCLALGMFALKVAAKQPRVSSSSKSKLSQKMNLIRTIML